MKLGMVYALLLEVVKYVALNFQFILYSSQINGGVLENITNIFLKRIMGSPPAYWKHRVLIKRLHKFTIFSYGRLR